MDEETCFRCGKKASLVEAIYDNEINLICESCALVENIPIIKKPTNFQLKESKKPYTVYERLRRMAGLHKEEKKPELRLDKIRPARDFSKTKEQREAEAVSGIIKDTSFVKEPEQLKKVEREAREKTEIEIPKEEFIEEIIQPIIPNEKSKPVGLTENFYWYLQRARRAHGLSTKQLAEHIAESEEDIKALERNESVENQDKIITKLEQYLRIKLKAGESPYLTKPESKMPARILKFDRETIKNLTIADLKRMKEEGFGKEEAENIEKEKLIGEDIEIEE